VLAVGEVEVLVAHVGVLLRLREVVGHGQSLEAVGLELLDRAQPLVLVHGVARQEEREEVAHARVVGHVIEPRDLQAALHLGVRVRVEVRHHVPAGGDVPRGPRVAVRVDGARAGAGDDRVLDIGAADDRGHGGVALHRVVGDPHRGLLEELRDHRREHLDVPELFRTDAEEQVAVLAGDVGVPRLEAVLHRHADLAVLPAEHLLELARVHGVRTVGGCLELQLLLVEEHRRSAPEPSWLQGSVRVCFTVCCDDAGMAARGGTHPLSPTRGAGASGAPRRRRRPRRSAAASCGLVPVCLCSESRSRHRWACTRGCLVAAGADGRAAARASRGDEPR
jgi:hypothetical protein